MLYNIHDLLTTVKSRHAMIDARGFVKAGTALAHTALPLAHDREKRMKMGFFSFHDGKGPQNRDRTGFSPFGLQRILFEYARGRIVKFSLHIAAHF